MAYSINKVILVGNVGRDPEIKTFQNGSRVANFTLATSERWKDKESGDLREQTEWHRVAIFNERLIALSEKHVNKGSKIYIEGQLQTRKWQDQSGQDKYSTEIVLQSYRGELVLLERSSSETRNNFESDLENENKKTMDDSKNKPVIDTEVLDDEIPF